ncbi:B12-binding domain-containing radical SAM protein [Caenimonas koreensis]|uniref:B12-binding domain-containing radical SAM protein n=1 Tax=Caenimonas koreensis TaxID=367474 RepID=UPI003783BF20
MNFPQAKHFKIVAHEPIKAAANLLNVALVNPPDPQSAGNERLMPPLGLGYIASYARAIGHDVDLFDYALDLDVSEEYLQKTGLFGKEYAVYGISTYTDTFAQGIKLAEKIRKNRPRCKIVMGGYHVSILHEETLRDFPVIDAVVRGEGEVTFSKYLEALSAGDEAMALLPGLTWRSGERVISNASAKTLVEQDLIPVPARDFKYSPGSYVEYLSRESGVTRRTISMVSSRGCPKRCTFCSITVLDPLWRARSVESMMFEIRKLYEQAPFDHILFEDANFFVRPTRTLEFSRKLFEFNPRITWSGTSTPDHIVKHKDVIKEIGALNCAALEVGIESGNEGSLKRFGKGNTVETNKAVIAVLEGSGIALGLDFIMFDPMMTTRELDANLDFIAGCGFQDSDLAPV